ncbi:Basic blue protein [Hibiscus syriacus]|uniref:Basic blue protein n=1 Tax=Hibiscus syriacus TaxID=106335 RepID=A0A6A3CEQ1_HIBSY|nr:basic blue protein-like [Hibiscus syriacus]KAE8727216.1 Basic blue protein [Hibiscus syriacus]
MVQGRCSAVAATVLLCLLSLHFESVRSATFTVGDSSGWTLNAVGWTKGKRFRAGDTLVFNYNPSIHNVVAVNRAGYSSCKAPKGAKVFSSGKDQIKLRKGQNFFICSSVGHCQSGMKIAAIAA